MNDKEELKTSVIECCINGTMTVSKLLTDCIFSERHVKTLKARHKNDGASSMLHGNRGRQPKHTISATIKNRIIKIRKQPEFQECNFEHFKELLEELYDIKISCSALYNLLRKSGIKSPRKHRKSKAHNRKKRRSSAGELLQADATPFPFFYGNDKLFSIHGFVDDDTGNITGSYMCENECMHGYLDVTIQTFNHFGVPLAIYANCSSIFFPKDNTLSIEQQLAGITKPLTHYRSMMDYLGVELIHARSSQAKGRIERLWDTLHDR